MSTTLKVENEIVLQGMAARGDDLSKARVVDYTAVFVDEASALTFAQRVQALGYTIDIELSQAVASHPWDSVASRKMIPSLDGITDAEVSLSIIARELNGRMDGWGCLKPD
ncbi:ribonuclease E inhibitor RraB [Caulobacter sp. DWR2-3-1b2]|uniref:ribonuclease E inhibitor RraB n=1 Tax=unclassified Caulobacter TaxID=2648921 RepID=UPI003CF47ADC